ncbi:ethanolamine utilization protein EutL [Fictibacillus macauensis ZFHKF-1]|uniref:Ethanolamine utilization protein EutL n=1 Tax=Fictibacillus macauensis ZFHKF-1 TaxID=1196324 RepID=I8AM68_9BACL|nr:ethanolamine utilization microcompartment protein EutL [Fictibacillus macauensis]EIT86764.1 ethanolamine utilization protein EutL [Fictibacillus macauensis ZFHKF-1]
MSLRRIQTDILAVRLIPNADAALCEALHVPSSFKSLGILTTTSDDVGFTALDEATKQANVEVAYAKSFYAGASHASGPLSGEFIGIVAGPTPDEVRSGIDAAIHTIEHEAAFEALDEEGNHALFAHVISRTGSYLSKVAGIAIGQPLAYLIAPPLEAVVGLDYALKAADVQLATFYGPPSETNYGGGLVTGTESACRAAAEAFREAIISIAKSPRSY